MTKCYNLQNAAAFARNATAIHIFVLNTIKKVEVWHLKSLIPTLKSMY